jgi:hypothetical protein
MRQQDTINQTPRLIQFSIVKPAAMVASVGLVGPVILLLVNVNVSGATLATNVSCKGHAMNRNCLVTGRVFAMMLLAYAAVTYLSMANCVNWNMHAMRRKDSASMEVPAILKQVLVNVRRILPSREPSVNYTGIAMCMDVRMGDSVDLGVSVPVTLLSMEAAVNLWTTPRQICCARWTVTVSMVHATHLLVSVSVMTQEALVPYASIVTTVLLPTSTFATIMHLATKLQASVIAWSRFLGQTAR